MPDLTEQQSSQAVKLTGADATGVETNYVGATANLDQLVADRANTSGVYGSITVGNSAVAIRVGGSNLSNRKSLVANNNSNAIIYWGYDSSVTTANGMPWAIGQTVSWAVGDSVTIYAIAGAPNKNVRVAESA
jgi:hypothetical protein